MHPHRTQSALVAFLYELLRDHVTVGYLEKIVSEQETAVNASEVGTGFTWVLSNGHLAAYAEELAERLADVRVPSDSMEAEIHARWRTWLHQMSESLRQDGQVSEAYAVALCATTDVGPDNPDEDLERKS